MTGDGGAPLRLYLLGVGALLLGQGAAGLLVRAAGHDPHGVTRLLSDPLHSVIHLGWGVLLLVVVLRGDAHAAANTVLLFGVFYVGFLVLGLLVWHPFGMEIDGKENAFHAVIGPLALVVWMHDFLRRRSRIRTARLGETA
jgi:hypothetical protein